MLETLLNLLDRVVRRYAVVRVQMAGVLLLHVPHQKATRVLNDAEGEDSVL